MNKSSVFNFCKILGFLLFLSIFFIPHSALALKCCLNEPGSFNVTPTVNGTMLNLSGTVTGGECSCACIIGLDGGRFNEEDGDPLSTAGGEIRCTTCEVVHFYLTLTFSFDKRIIKEYNENRK